MLNVFTLENGRLAGRIFQEEIDRLQGGLDMEMPPQMEEVEGGDKLGRAQIFPLILSFRICSCFCDAVANVIVLD